MGHRVIDGRVPTPHLWLAWHDEPYLDTADCWGCGLPTDLLSPVYHGLSSIPGQEPPRRPECVWCSRLAAVLYRLHLRRYDRPGFMPPIVKPSVPPRGPSGISPGRNGTR